MVGKRMMMRGEERTGKRARIQCDMSGLGMAWCVGAASHASMLLDDKQRFGHGHVVGTHQWQVQSL